MAPEDVNKRRAPDGGWGWFVCLGSSLISLSLRSLDPSFGLLFQDLLEDLKVDSTGTSLIMSVLDAIVNFSGLGTGLALASSFVALNTFFDKKRGQAVGFSMAGTTLAMMLVPQVIHVLLQSYGFRGTMLIVGGWALHSVVGACLLRPLDLKNDEPVKKAEKPTETDALLSGNANALRNSLNNSFELTKKDATHQESKDAEKPEKEGWLEKIRNTFDLDLLKDPVYLNVIIGLGLYYVAESNFKLMTPFFLADIGMSNAEIASCLSVTAFTDILARLTLPTVFDRIGVKKRSVFWICCLLVGLGRSTLAEQTKGMFLMVTFVVIGFLRGATLVNLNLSVSEHCSLKKLPSAFGIFMVLKGMLVVTLSPMIGYIRDVTDSYTICIHVMTGMIIATFTTWTVEFLFAGLRRRRAALAKQAKAETIE